MCGVREGMSVDWIADNLYWTDEEKGEIIMSRLDGRYRRVLVRGLNRPKYITVNPLTGSALSIFTDSVVTYYASAPTGRRH